MEDLYILIEEDKSIKKKITKAMKQLKEWFLERIDTLKEYFRDLKDKLKYAVRRKGPKLKRDLVVDGKVIYKKGTPTEIVIGNMYRELKITNRDVNESIQECKKGIRNVDNKLHDKALFNKRRVTELKVQIMEQHNKLLKYAQVIVMTATATMVARNKYEKSKKDYYDYKMQKEKWKNKDV